MALQLRSVALLAGGVVLGFVAAFGGNLVADRYMARAPYRGVLSPESSTLLTEVIARVRREYVDRIEEKNIVEGAIRGIVRELDQHSTYLSPEQYEDVLISTSGNYTGIGLDVSLEEGKITVVAPLDGAPAAKAGILPGDVVLSVDDVPVDTTNIQATVNRMRGKVGTEVTLDVQRPGSDKPLRFALTRTEVKVQTVSSEYFGNGLAYLRLSSFAESTPRDLAQAARQLRQEAGGKLRGVVLDLRNNPGGVLDAAVRVADVFLKGGMIVRGTGRARQARFEQQARPGDELEDVPLVVLVNGGSASASEIVAAALQDHHRAKLVGERTYGKGSVQTVMPIGGDAALKLTTSRYVTPAGRMINGYGVDPDVVVVNDNPHRQYRGLEHGVALAEDRQLVEALRLISYDSIILSEAQKK
jgi:carboxyl-terminal processing protease